MIQPQHPVRHRVWIIHEGGIQQTAIRVAAVVPLGIVQYLLDGHTSWYLDSQLFETFDEAWTALRKQPSL